MNFKIEIDCTPEEARHFLGLPVVEGMQKRLMEVTEKRLVEAISSMDSKTLMDQWMPLSVRGFEQMQNLWAQLATTAVGLGGRGKSGKKD